MPNPLPAAGNNYLGSECDHLPEAIFVLRKNKKWQFFSPVL
jgi:hypothetical protein